MEDEQIIRSEAKQFYDFKISLTRHNVIEQIHKLQNRLLDFYSDVSKATFLDEIEGCITEELADHRDKQHSGEAVASCPYEINAEKLLFYLRQELSILPLIAHQRFSTPKEKLQRDLVFVSYSHSDQTHLDAIRQHFKPFLKNIVFWDDSQIQVGSKWKQEIEKAIEKTKVAILLVSTDFLGSDFISTNELPPLLEAAEKDGTVIISVILKPCLFEEFSELNQYQTLNPPNRPVSMMDENERDNLYVNLVRQTKRFLEEN